MYLALNNELIKIKIAQTWQEKVKGLMKEKVISYGLLIPECNAVHTFLMRDNIDILFLDENQMILAKYQNLGPNKIVSIKEPIKKTNVLELPKNTSQSLKIGQILRFELKDII